MFLVNLQKNSANSANSAPTLKTFLDLYDPVLKDKRLIEVWEHDEKVYKGLIKDVYKNLLERYIKSFATYELVKHRGGEDGQFVTIELVLSVNLI